MSRALLVTGGCGFIGANFVRAAHSAFPEARIRVLDALTYAGREETLWANVAAGGRVELVRGSVTDGRLVDELVADADAVVHIAAESHVDYSARDARVFVETNVMGTATFLESILRHPVERLLYISSSEVYGTAQRDPMDEDHPLMPASPYAGSKAAADRLVYSFVRTHGIPAVILRPFNNYGPFQHVEKVIPRFITLAFEGRPLPVHDDGSQTRDWLYVDDTCAALVAALRAPIDSVRGEVVNIGTGKETSVLEIAERVIDREHLPRDLVRPGARRRGQVWRHRSSTEKAERLLGWRPTTSLDVGLDRTIEWYRANEAWWTALKPSLALV